MSAPTTYDAQRDGVRAFFADPAATASTYVPDAGPDGRPAFTVKAVAAVLELSETRAGDILVELERAGELERTKVGRAFAYWRAESSAGARDSEPAVTTSEVEPLAPEAGGCAHTLQDGSQAWRCGLDEGHDGDHFADDPDGGITWSIEDAAEPAESDAQGVPDASDGTCRHCGGEGVVERLATPDEVDAGCELGVAFDPCPACNAQSAATSGPHDPVDESLALLRKLGGKAYAGAQDDSQRRMIDMTNALHLEAAGVVRLVSRRSYQIVELLEELVDAAPGETPQPSG